MRCLSPAEVEAISVEPQFRVSLAHIEYRSQLYLDPVHAKTQSRIAAEQPSDIKHTPEFVRQLNRWLPTNRARLLWVDHWETGLRNGGNAIVALAWRGLGETRSLEQAPGVFFDKQDWREDDQLAISSTQAEARSILAGIVAMLMMTLSDGWLVSPGCADRIEFWEGNFFFHSDNSEQLRLANEIVDTLGCVRWKTSQ